MRPVIATLLLLPACAGDVTLLAAPPRGVTEPVELAPPSPAVVVPPPASPWGNLDPGSLPDLRFVVAHSDWDCSGVGDGYARDLWSGCPASYAVVDLRGQVLMEIPVADLLGPPVDPAAVGHHSIVPAGPGKVMISLQYEMFDDAGGDIAAGGDYPNYAVLFDAWTGASEVVARWPHWGSRVYLPQTGRFLHLPTRSGPTMVGPWPGTDELAIWQADWSCVDAPLDLLWRVDPRGDGWALGRWEATDLGIEMPGRPLCFGGDARTLVLVILSVAGTGQSVEADPFFDVARIAAAYAALLNTAKHNLDSAAHVAAVARVLSQLTYHARYPHTELQKGAEPVGRVNHAQGRLAQAPVVEVSTPYGTRYVAPVPDLVVDWLYEPALDRYHTAARHLGHPHAAAKLFEAYVCLLLDAVAGTRGIWEPELVADLRGAQGVRVVDWALPTAEALVVVDAKRCYVAPEVRAQVESSAWRRVEQTVTNGVAQIVSFTNEVRRGRFSAFAAPEAVIGVVLTHDDVDRRASHPDFHSRVDRATGAGNAGVEWLTLTVADLEHLTALAATPSPAHLARQLREAAQAERAAVRWPTSGPNGPLWERWQQFVESLRPTGLRGSANRQPLQ